MPSEALAQEGTLSAGAESHAGQGQSLPPRFRSKRTLSVPSGGGMVPAMYYVYLIEGAFGHRYVGFTTDLRRRIDDHNQGRLPNTRRYRPWSLRTYLAFSHKKQALGFETHIKAGSGHAFAKRHLWPDSP